MADQPQFLKKIKPVTVKKKSKVIFYGDAPTCATGFGQVSRNILPALHASDRYDVDILGINYWGDPHDYPFKIWPMAVNGQRDPYGRERLQQHLMDPKLEFDILFFLQDTFILDFLPAMLSNVAKTGKRFKSVYYYPIDGIPKPAWIDSAACVDYPVTYTQFGFDESVKIKPELADRLGIIPHGVNPKVFFPAPESQVKEFRGQYFGVLADKFIFTNVNRNQQRKDIPATIAAFKEFRKHRPDSILYLHMMSHDQGWNLPEVLKAFELDVTKDVILPQKFTAASGFPLEVVNLIYNASDCVLSTTVGEGWGLCLGPESKIYTKDGVKSINKVTVKDEVLSSDGTYNPVVGISSRNYSGEVNYITTWMSNIPLIASDEHRILRKSGDYLKWIQAGELKEGDFLVYPKKYSLSSPELDLLGLTKSLLPSRVRLEEDNDNRTFTCTHNLGTSFNYLPFRTTIDEDLMRVFGFYVAEGSLAKNKSGIRFSFHQDEEEYIHFIAKIMKEKFGLVQYEDVQNTREDYKGRTVVFYNAPLARIFNFLFGSSARNKTIHPLLLNQNEDLLSCLLNGLFFGDGHFSNSNNEIQLSSTSTNVAYLVRLILARLGIVSSVRSSREEFKISVSGSSRRRLASLFNITLANESSIVGDLYSKIEEDYIFLPIKKIERKEYVGKLIDICVEDKHDFLAENFIVHNSWTEAMATKTPIIFPNNTCLGEYITEETGFPYPSGGDADHVTILPHDNEVLRPTSHVNKMVGRMIELYDNREEGRRRAETAYNMVHSNLIWDEHINPQWLNLFDSIVASMAKPVEKSSGDLSNPTLKGDLL